MDKDHDGNLSLQDFEKMEQNSTKHGVSNDTILTLDELWRIILLDGKSKLSNGEFVQMMKENYESDQLNFVQTMKKLNDKWFEVIDYNKDGYVSVEEYVMDMKAFGHEKNVKDDDFYYSHRLVNYRIPLDEATEVLLRFLTEKDRSKTDIIVVAFESGL